MACTPKRNLITHAVAACCAGETNSTQVPRVFFRLGLALALSAADPVSAATFEVTNINDSGPGSLRQAVIDANSNAGLDEISFSSISGTITLSSGQMNITEAVRLLGPGAEQLTIDAGGATTIFHIEALVSNHDDSPGGVEVSGLTMTNARGPAIHATGQGVFNPNVYESFALRDSVISGNGTGLESRYAVGSINDTTVSRNDRGLRLVGGSVRVANTILSGNETGVHAYGGRPFGDSGGFEFIDSVVSRNQTGMDIYDTARVQLENSIVSNNFTGIYGLPLRVSNSTIADNRGFGITADTSDAGPYSHSFEMDGSTVSGNGSAGIELVGYAQQAVINNSTISANGGSGLRIFVGPYDSHIEVSNTTIVGNKEKFTAGGGIYFHHEPNPDTEFALRNSIVAGNTATVSDSDLSGEFSVVYSLIREPDSATINEPVPGSNLFGQDPQLGPLQNNGGPTLTHTLFSGSPAVDSGDPAFSPPPDGDQRGLPRVVNGRIDMGAYELQSPSEIGDFIWHDLNGNGIQDTGEPGLADATVRLLDCTGAVLATTTSGPNGDYRFDGLMAGRYRVGFVAPPGFAFSPPARGDKRGRDSNPDPDTGFSTCRSLSEGKVRLGIDAGFARLPAGSGEIGDLVWHDLNGDGIRDAGEPGLEGVRMRLQKCNGHVVHSTVSDANGAYRFRNLPVGNYKVEFITPEGFSLSARNQGNQRGRDSNPFPDTGLSFCLAMPEGKVRLGIDAGMKSDDPN